MSNHAPAPLPQDRVLQSHTLLFKSHRHTAVYNASDWCEVDSEIVGTDVRHGPYYPAFAEIHNLFRDGQCWVHGVCQGHMGASIDFTNHETYGDDNSIVATLIVYR